MTATLQMCFACSHQFPLANLNTYTIRKDVQSILKDLRNRITLLQRNATSSQRPVLIDMEGDCRTLALLLSRDTTTPFSSNEFPSAITARAVHASTDWGRSPQPPIHRSNTPSSTRAPKIASQASTLHSIRPKTGATSFLNDTNTHRVNTMVHPPPKPAVSPKSPPVTARGVDDPPIVPQLRFEAGGMHHAGYTARGAAAPSSARWPSLRQKLMNSVGCTTSTITPISTGHAPRTPDVLGHHYRLLRKRQVDTIGSALYVLTHSLKEKTRARTARLWLLHSAASEQIAAPIEIGDRSQTCSTYHRLSGPASPVVTPVSSGIVGCVVSSGIALSIASKDGSTVNMLLMPIGRRKKDGKGIYGVIQLTDKRNADVFSTIDEHFTLTVADLCAHICLQHSDAIAALSNTLFDPPMQTKHEGNTDAHGTFPQERQDADANRTGFQIHDNSASSRNGTTSKMRSLDDVYLPCQLIYRPSLNGTDAFFPADADMVEICSSIKDAGQHIQNLETSWRSSLTTIQTLRSKDHHLSIAFEQNLIELSKYKQQVASTQPEQSSTPV